MQEVIKLVNDLTNCFYQHLVLTTGESEDNEIIEKKLSHCLLIKRGAKGDQSLAQLS